mmetsp:Transcript_14154/g.24051  ORF Transcript_14154/g.24051 Transcript_14154/m.24051 type:complete len:216 (-) Transcript_14154:367-1014(-)
MSVTDLSNKYRDCYPVENTRSAVTRNLIQGSEKKKQRLMYADPNDHSFNYTKRFVQRETNPFSISNYEQEQAPMVKQGPLSKRVCNLNTEMEDELITVLKDIINHEREVEEAKIRVAQHQDFNLVDGYNLIDQQNRGYVTADQLQDNLQVFGLFCHREDIYTFMKRFDADSDGRILYSDFCDAFSPKDTYFQQALSNRQAYFVHTNMPKASYFTE